MPLSLNNVSYTVDEKRIVDSASLELRHSSC
jgi:hypothetical protein